MVFHRSVHVVIAAGLSLIVALPAATASPAGSARQADYSSTAVKSGVPTPNFFVDQDGWIRYGSKLQELNLGFAGVRRDQGQVEGPVDGETLDEVAGCVFTSQETTPSHDAEVVVEEESAFNPNTCTREISTFHLSEYQAEQFGIRNDNLGATEEQLLTEGGDPGTGTAFASSSWSHWMRTKWVDPINIDISSQFSGLRWSKFGWEFWKTGRDSFKGCVRGVCLDETYVVSQDQSVKNLSSETQFKVKTHFRNTSFSKWVVGLLGASGWAACGFPTRSQADFYHRTTISGRYNGVVVDAYSDKKSGACTNLVHHVKISKWGRF